MVETPSAWDSVEDCSKRNMWRKHKSKCTTTSYLPKIEPRCLHTRLVECTRSGGTGGHHKLKSLMTGMAKEHVRFRSSYGLCSTYQENQYARNASTT